jgi:hypothetical protein
MANTVSVNAKLTVSNNVTNGSVSAGRNVTPTVSGNRYLYNIQAVTTVAEAMAYNDLSSLRYVSLTNPTDSAKTVTVTTAAIVLQPGDSAVFPPADLGVTLQATGAVDVTCSGTEA